MTIKENAAKDELLLHYRPVALKAVRAAHEIKRQLKPASTPMFRSAGPLPPGFHMPDDLD